MNYIIEKLKAGTIRKITKGDETLLAYETCDPIQDQVILIKKGDVLVSIEGPLFKNNVEELNEYISKLGIKKSYILLSDHVAIKNYLPEAKLLTAKYSLNALLSGGPVYLFNNFVSTFKDCILDSIRDDFTTIDDDLDLDGIKLKLINKGEEFDVVIPTFNAVYTHMLGHDCHSIVNGKEGCSTFRKELTSFIDNNYEIVLTSHYIPETITDVKTKIAYLDKLSVLASNSTNKEEFINKMKDEFKGYSGLNYLEMTASSYFEK